MKRQTLLMALATLALASCGTNTGPVSSDSSPVDSSLPSESIDDSSAQSAADASEAGTSSEVDSSDSESVSEEGDSSEGQSSDSSADSSEASSTAPEQQRWTLVEDANELTAGDIILIGVASKGVLASSAISSGPSSTYLNAVLGTYDSSDKSFVDPSESVGAFTLGISSTGGWTLSNDSGLLGSKGTQSLAYGEGSTSWTINIDNGQASIKNGDYGLLGYYATRNRFTVYASASSSVSLPQIYRGFAAEKTYPTAISISGNNEVSTGKTTKLSVSFEPSDATARSVRWNSLSPSVATVDEAGVVRGVSEGIAVIEAFAQSSEGVYDVKSTFTVTVTESAHDTWTIMIYLCGSDLESSMVGRQVSGYASLDISEILSVGDQPDDINIIIQTGGASRWASTYGISAQETGRYHVEDGALVKDAGLPKANMGKASTLQSFLEWGLTEYPAEKTGVVLWNHGGAMDGVCYDENYKYDSLSASEVLSALDGAFDAVDRNEKLEFIGYDACLMGIQDLAVVNADYFNYMVASQELEAGEGWAYSSWLAKLYDYAPTTEILEDICDSFVESYGTDYGNDQTCSALDLSKAGDYEAAFEAMASDIKSVGKKDALRSLAITTRSFGDRWMDAAEYADYIDAGYPEEWFTSEREGRDIYYFLPGYYENGSFDVLDFINKLDESSTFGSVDVTAVKTALSDLVIYNAAGSDAGEAHGLSLILPITELIDCYGPEIDAFPTWRSYVNKF